MRPRQQYQDRVNRVLHIALNVEGERATGCRYSPAGCMVGNQGILPTQAFDTNLFVIPKFLRRGERDIVQALLDAIGPSDNFGEAGTVVKTFG
ncbi:MAG: hypothetical protein HY820_42125 [Acidobacteria bacterium]|nr:hypothetical protein [Acidobacteriota bacterium]